MSNPNQDLLQNLREQFPERTECELKKMLEELPEAAYDTFLDITDARVSEGNY